MINRDIIKVDKRSNLLSPIVITLVLLITMQTASFSSNRYALLIGVSKFENNKYPKNSANNDIDTISAILTDLRCINRPWQLSTLRDREATIDRVTSVLDSITDILQGGDELLLYFAGHGSRVADINGDEEDGFDEGLILYDNILIDDRLNRYITKYREILGSKGEIAILIDACFSGTIEKSLGGGVCRGVDGIEESLKSEEMELSHIWDTKEITKSSSLPSGELASLYVLTASQANSMAYEIDSPYYIDGINRYYGTFTIAICDLFSSMCSMLTLYKKEITFKRFKLLLEQTMRQSQDGAYPYIYVSSSSECKWIKSQ